MLTVLSNPRRTCDGFTRRELLQIGGAGMLGLSLPKLLAAESVSPSLVAKAKSVIFVFLYGGPSQLDIRHEAGCPEHGPGAVSAGCFANSRLADL